MTWIIGIDEAGYGPKLGPFVMTAVACRVPEKLAGRCLWETLRRVVRRYGKADRNPNRILIEDSKLVYSTTRGLRLLELGVLATVLRREEGYPASLDHLLEEFSPAAWPELRAEPWYTGTTSIPIEVEPEMVDSFACRFRKHCCSRDVIWGPVRTTVICPPRFNGMIDRWGSKGDVLGLALEEVLPCPDSLGEDGEPLCVFIDKHGGRDRYAAVLQQALPGGMVVVREEGPQRSTYDVLGVGRDVRVTIQPRADGRFFCVALASMVSKYLREALMREFNSFWQNHVPGLQATAGYPGDAERYWDEIRPVAEKLGLAPDTLWRRR